MRKNNKRFLRRGIALLLLLFMILSPGAGFTSAAEPEDISVSGTAGADGTEDAAAGSGAVDAASDEAGEPASDGAESAPADAASNGTVSYSLAPSSAYDYDDILYAWRTNGKSLKSLLQGSTGSGTSIGGISLSYKTIPVDYNFSLGGDMSGKTLQLAAARSMGQNTKISITGETGRAETLISRRTGLQARDLPHPGFTTWRQQIMIRLPVHILR